MKHGIFQVRVILCDVHGGPYRASRSRWCSSNIASLPSTIWVQCHPRTDRVSRHPDRNTLILIGQIKTNQEEGLNSYHAVIEATVQRSRPVILTALAAVLAFIPLTFSVFWGSMAFTLIGGTAVGTVLTLIFLPALYSIWFGAKPKEVPSDEAQAVLVPV